ncbi:hypothetical protein I3J09_02580 [Streptomyces clavuligerus]|uniref:Uncharacterized protein n=1 Tax=Streptomyces clavuligerus TaxID=1901 RepID=B5GVK6_STRCL|nr:hypothetical protein D1794_02710 [Streptomyces clavuligerus]EDY50352.1 conserved hypothetical protein [Streptomyces clavuligerus]EFG10355.1 Hypothetical protein SCLAV_5282 [Streptomyces clavuligerus]MBY6301562.1 hypothetical protein [Streptomyces clavuligerus]QCS04502.1 hypothetical protein CRV15_02145 [Streptomyces clavuligerus]
MIVLTADLSPPGFSTTVEALRLRSRQLGPGQPMLVIDQFADADFKLLVDDAPMSTSTPVTGVCTSAGFPRGGRARTGRAGNSP